MKKKPKAKQTKLWALGAFWVSYSAECQISCQLDSKVKCFLTPFTYPSNCALRWPEHGVYGSCFVPNKVFPQSLEKLFSLRRFIKFTRSNLHWCANLVHPDHTFSSFFNEYGWLAMQGDDVLISILLSSDWLIISHKQPPGISQFSPASCVIASWL